MINKIYKVLQRRGQIILNSNCIKYDSFQLGQIDFILSTGSYINSTILLLTNKNELIEYSYNYATLQYNNPIAMPNSTNIFFQQMSQLINAIEFDQFYISIEKYNQNYSAFNLIRKNDLSLVKQEIFNYKFSNIALINSNYISLFGISQDQSKFIYIIINLQLDEWILQLIYINLEIKDQLKSILQVIISKQWILQLQNITYSQYIIQNQHEALFFLITNQELFIYQLTLEAEQNYNQTLSNIYLTTSINFSQINLNSINQLNIFSNDNVFCVVINAIDTNNQQLLGGVFFQVLRTENKTQLNFLQKQQYLPLNEILILFQEKLIVFDNSIQILAVNSEYFAISSSFQQMESFELKIYKINYKNKQILQQQNFFKSIKSQQRIIQIKNIEDLVFFGTDQGDVGYFSLNLDCQGMCSQKELFISQCFCQNSLQVMIPTSPFCSKNQQKCKDCQQSEYCTQITDAKIIQHPNQLKFNVTFDQQDQLYLNNLQNFYSGFSQVTFKNKQLLNIQENIIYFHHTIEQIAETQTLLLSLMPQEIIYKNYFKELQNLFINNTIEAALILFCENIQNKNDSQLNKTKLQQIFNITITQICQLNEYLDQDGKCKYIEKYIEGRFRKYQDNDKTLILDIFGEGDKIEMLKIANYSISHNFIIEGLNKTDYSFEITQKSDNKIEIKISFAENLKNISNNQVAKVFLQIPYGNNNSIQIKQNPITFILPEFYSLPESNDIKKTITQVIKTISETTTAIVAAILPNPSAAKNILMLGLIELLKFQRINYTQNAINIFNKFQPFPPPFFKFDPLFKEKFEDSKELPGKFIDYEVSPYSFNNNLESYLQDLLFIIVGLILSHIRKIFNTTHSTHWSYKWLFKFISWLINVIVWNFVYFLLISNYIGLCLYSYLNIYFYSFNSNYGKINFIIAIATASLNALFIFHLINIITVCSKIDIELKKYADEGIKINSENELKKQMTIKINENNNKSNELQQQFQSFNTQFLYHKFLLKVYVPKTIKQRKEYIAKYTILYSDYKESKKLQRYFVTIDIIRMNLLTFVVVFFHFSSMTQSMICALILLTFIGYLVKYRPQIDFYVLLMTLLMEFSLFIAYLAALIQASIGDVNQKYNTLENKTKLGNMIFYGAQGITLFSSIMMLISIYRTTKSVLVTAFCGQKIKKQLEQKDLEKKNDLKNFEEKDQKSVELQQQNNGNKELQDEGIEQQYYDWNTNNQENYQYEDDNQWNINPQNDDQIQDIQETQAYQLNNF